MKNLFATPLIGHIREAFAKTTEAKRKRCGIMPRRPKMLRRRMQGKTCNRTGRANPPQSESYFGAEKAAARFTTTKEKEKEAKTLAKYPTTRDSPIRSANVAQLEAETAGQQS